VYPILVSRVLESSEWLANVDASREILLLLKDGYPTLSTSGRDTVISLLMKGPPAEDAAKLANWAHQTYGDDPETYQQRHVRMWIRDRLWMIRDYLTGHPAQVLDDLVAEEGAREHPELMSQTVGGWVQDASPSTDQELAVLPPSELTQYVLLWQPPLLSSSAYGRLPIQG